MKQDKPGVPPLEIQLFGGFEARVDGRPLPPLRSRREQWLLALLVLRQGRDTSRDWLAASLWPDNDMEQALFYLRKSLSNLRKALGEAAYRLLSPTPRAVRLDLTGAFVDVVSFDGALSRAVGSSDSEAALREAVALYLGPLLPDCLEEWAAVERNHREQAYLAALESLAALCHEQRDSAATVRWLRLLVSSDPYRESAYCTMMRALYDRGDRAAIKQVYGELRLRLRQDLNINPSPETEALYGQVMQLERPVAFLPATHSNSDEARRNLPVPLSDLIGREVEITAILDWMKRRRLMTLVGAGGVGKTRMAIAVAERALPRFDQGVRFVDLAPLSDPALALHATASALGVAEEQLRPLIDTLIEELKPHSLLLVLDNCEHLEDAPASIAHLLLSACPFLSIIATSRHALEVPGEQIFRVPSLQVPHAEFIDIEMDPHALMKYDAVRLLVDRAARVNSHFQLDGRNARAVVEICRKLDGIPLAIEMAAARLRSMSAGEIEARLSDRFRLLTTGNRGAMPRHQTLRAATDWSYDLLSSSEQALLCRMSVFAGGCDLERAGLVCMGDPLEDQDIGHTLASLSDKSLVATDEHNGATRYRLLETVRQYALDRLTEGGELHAWRDCHLASFLALAEEAEPHLVGREERVWQSRLETEHDNLRSALAWATDEGRQAESALRMCGAMLYFWLGRGYFVEGRNWCRIALERANGGAKTAAQAATLHCAGRLAYAQCEYATARTLFEESLSISRERDDLRAVSQALNGLGIMTCDQGDFDASRSFHEQSLAIRREIGDPWTTSQTLNNLGVVASAQGDYSAARALLEESLSVRRRIGVQRGTSIVLLELGKVALEEGDFATAQTLLDESLSIRREVADLSGIAESLLNLGNVAHEVGDLSHARILYEESLSIATRLRVQETIARLLESFAELAMAGAEVLPAARLWGAAERLREEFGGSLWIGPTRRHDARVAAARAVTQDDPAFDAAWKEGRIMSVEAAVEYALVPTFASH